VRAAVACRGELNIKQRRIASVTGVSEGKIRKGKRSPLKFGGHRENLR
jgi:hypothetical protein